MIIFSIIWNDCHSFQNGDGIPDRPLRYEFDSVDPAMKSIVQFPLGFCPSGSNASNPHIQLTNCSGQWGFVFKEWETITAVSVCLVESGSALGEISMHEKVNIRGTAFLY